MQRLYQLLRELYLENREKKEETSKREAKTLAN
jgi:hypothetical protein